MDAVPAMGQHTDAILRAAGPQRRRHRTLRVDGAI
jgi:hypothetical protein